MIYTISTNFFKQLKAEEYSCLASILFQFSNTQADCKIAIDAQSLVLDKYRDITHGMFCADIVRTWLELLSNISSSIEKCNVDLSNVADSEEMCVKVCSCVNGARNLIIHSFNSYPLPLEQDNSLLYDGKVIKVMDKDQAQLQLNNTAAIKIEKEDYLVYIQRLLRENEELKRMISMPINTLQEVKSRLAYFKQVIENNDGYKLCYRNGRRVSQESDLQLMFRFVWYESETSVDREVNNGRGPVDYKISKGRKDETLVEFKLASSTKLKQNLKNQLSIYKNANQTEFAIAVIVYFSQKELKRVNAILKELQLEGNENIMLIDASKKESASNAKSTNHLCLSQ